MESGFPLKPKDPGFMVIRRLVERAVAVSRNKERLICETVGDDGRKSRRMNWTSLLRYLEMPRDVDDGTLARMENIALILITQAPRHNGAYRKKRYVWLGRMVLGNEIFALTYLNSLPQALTCGEYKSVKRFLDSAGLSSFRTVQSRLRKFKLIPRFSSMPTNAVIRNEKLRKAFAW